MPVFKRKDNFDWEDVPILAYKEEGTHFKSITRRTLYKGADALQAELRYFEIGPGGHSTLERHEHLHVVMIQRGQGAVLVGTQIHDIDPFDIIEIPSNTWHQFRATKDEPLGFLCLVNINRDRPHRPDANEIEALKSDLNISNFIRL